MFLEFKGLVEKIENSSNKYDLELIEKAYVMAEKAHKGQFRSSGEAYVTHPVTVAGLLVEMGMDSESVIAAILHDVAEDTEITIEEIKKEFSEDIGLLVDGVTKLGQISFTTKEERQAENVRKMLLAMSQDIRVIIIKLCDRLHNTRTLSARPHHKQIAKSKETMDVYAPIAHRLGMMELKEELEDISIKYLDPYGCGEIEKLLYRHKEDRENIIDEIVEQLKNTMGQEYKAFIYGRVKSLFGIYRKMYLGGKEFEDIYDIYGVRIVVHSIGECYNVLGIMHDIFKPIPNRFKDYISMPKQNMYQSLHTTVISKEGIPFEIQIRTWDMQHTSEYGVAAHWKYKEGGKARKDKLDERLSWIRQLLESQVDSDDKTDILANIKSDLASEDVFIFTPTGDVKSLPIGSTVIDFAYAIHSEVGNKMVGAKVNGKIVPIDYEVSTGEVVEVMTQNNGSHGPSRDWLNIVHTSEARNKIRSWYKKEKREENIVMGKSEIEKEFKRNCIYLTKEEILEFTKEIARRQHYPDLENFYAAIGYGGVHLSKIMQRVKDDYLKMMKERKMAEEPILTKIKKTKANNGVMINGIDNCLVKFSKCCNPLPGDSIIGFITRGYGVSIHKTDCVNVNTNEEENGTRWIGASWEENVHNSYRSTIIINAINGNNLLVDVSVQLSSMRVPVYELISRNNKEGDAEIQMTIGINNVEHLNSIVKKLKKIKNVITVKRIGV